MKSRDGKSQREEKSRILEERRWEKRKSQKKEDADARKGRKVAKHCVFPMIWGSGGSKSRLAKAAIAEPSGQMRDEKCTPFVARSTFRSQSVQKTHHARTTFESWDVEKVHAVLVRSTFPSANVQNTPGSEHFWKLRCRKSARHCGVKHIPCQKWAKREGFCSISKNDGRRWQAWDIWRGSAKMHFPWQAQYKRHLHQSC